MLRELRQYSGLTDSSIGDFLWSVHDQHTLRYRARQRVISMSGPSEREPALCNCGLIFNLNEAGQRPYQAAPSSDLRRTSPDGEPQPHDQRSLTCPTTH